MPRGFVWKLYHSSVRGQRFGRVVVDGCTRSATKTAPVWIAEWDSAAHANVSLECRLLNFGQNVARRAQENHGLVERKVGVVKGT